MHVLCYVMCHSKQSFLHNTNTVVTEWADEPRPSSNILRLIYQGRFLHGNVTLAGITAYHLFTYFVLCQPRWHKITVDISILL